MSSIQHQHQQPQQNQGRAPVLTGLFEICDDNGVLATVTAVIYPEAGMFSYKNALYRVTRYSEISPGGRLFGPRLSFSRELMEHRVTIRAVMENNDWVFVENARSANHLWCNFGNGQYEPVSRPFVALQRVAKKWLKRRHDQPLQAAFMMIAHPRLGGASPLRGFDGALLAAIARMI